ncbi:MAG TPA: hypothetical protein VFJ16_21715 [Longimicrobium sp.]|nr:hypothetical protein [Longimicrobium sp.]
MTPLFRRFYTRTLAALALTAAALLAPAIARAQIPPNAHWSVIPTTHFRVHYTPGLEPLARRAGIRAEEAYAELSTALIRPPGGRIDLVVTDNVDFANGFASPFPRNRVVIFAHPPVDEPTLAFYDDWVDLVLTHELTHIFHLDYARGLARLPRAVLGRAPVSFPHTTTPDWTKEGLATYLESRLTRAGRVRGTYHDMVLRAAVLEGRFFPLDRTSGDPASWPGGNTRYVYGSMFLTWLSDTHGEQSAGEFVRRYGGQIVPFLNDRAARGAYGISFSAAYREWRAQLETRYRALADSLRAGGLTEPQVLTGEGYEAEFPRWSPDGRVIAFGSFTAREQREARVVDAEGRERTLASRTTQAPASWTADGRGLITSMIDARDPYRYYSDLFRIDAAGGRERLTSGARIMAPDVARDGRIVALRNAPGTTVPVVMDAPGSTPRELAAPSLDVQWAAPRWSPDGTRIAIARWRQGGFYDIVVLDPSGRIVTQVTDDRAVDMTPAWSPDGRYVLFSSDRTGISNLFAYDTQGGRLMQVTSVLTGAFQPDVSPDGRWIAFQYYRSDGYHVARIPFDPSAWRAAPPVRPSVAPAPQPDPARMTDVPARSYHAWRSVLPAYWEPTIYDSGAFGTALGVATSGNDVIERHLWGAFAQMYTRDGRFEGGAGYLFRGLGNPVLGVSAFQDWDALGTFAVETPEGPVASTLEERERSASVTATFAQPRFRSYSWLSVGANVRDRVRNWSDPQNPGGVVLLDPPLDVGGIVTVGTSTVRAYPFSVSPQDGFVAAASVEGRRFVEALPEETGIRGYTRVTGRTQGYRGFRGWGFARHVAAVRAVAAADFGSRTPLFTAGGITGDVLGTPLGTGFGLSSTRDVFVRGWPEGAQIGDRVVAGTAEWRFPLLLVQRGIGLVPVYLDRTWGTMFVDAGTAWCAEQCDPQLAALFPRADPMMSVGAEVGGDFVFGFNLGMRLRAGVAVPVTRTTILTGLTERPSPRAYLTFGQSF